MSSISVEGWRRSGPTLSFVYGPVLEIEHDFERAQAGTLPKNLQLKLRRGVQHSVEKNRYRSGSTLFVLGPALEFTCDFARARSLQQNMQLKL